MKPITTFALSLLLALPGCSADDAGDGGGPPLPPDGAPPRIAAGGQHTCAVRDGTVFCWGAGNASQLGQGRSGDHTSPVAVPGLAGVEQVALGYEFSCARTGGDAWCWGANANGALGDGSSDIQVSPTPVVLDAVERWPDRALGHWSSCAVHGGGQVSCWGDNSRGQLGLGSVDENEHPAPARLEVARTERLALGYFHACAALADGTVRCWGSNGWGEVGNGDLGAEPVPSPVAVEGLSDARQLAAGQQWSCALRATGEVVCWGDNRNGQLGDGTTSFRTTPVAVPGLAAVRQIAAGRKHACAVTDDGALWCWGRNDVGQVGDGTTTERLSPTRVLDGVREVALGDLHTCALRSDGGATCFGSNERGQLGDGTTTDRASPVSVRWP